MSKSALGSHKTGILSEFARYKTMSDDISSEEEILELTQYIRKGIDELSSGKKLSAEARSEKISTLSDKLSRLRSAYQSFKLEITDLPRDRRAVYEQVLVLFENLNVS